MRYGAPIAWHLLEELKVTLTADAMQLETVIWYEANSARRLIVHMLGTDPDREGEAIAWHLLVDLKVTLTSNRA